MNDQLAIVSTSRDTNNHDHHQNLLQESDQDHEEEIRDIHALTPPRPPPSYRTDSNIHRSSSLSVTSEGASSENFTSMSREFNALVIAGSTIVQHGSEMDNNTVHSSSHNLGRIGEDDIPEETNPLAIVPDYNPLGTGTGGSSPSSRHPATGAAGSSSMVSTGHHSVQRVKKEEVESKISAWQTAKVAKVNNRFKREDAVISGWESEQVQKANSWMKKVEVRKNRAKLKLAKISW